MTTTARSSYHQLKKPIGHICESSMLVPKATVQLVHFTTYTNVNLIILTWNPLDSAIRLCLIWRSNNCNKDLIMTSMKVIWKSYPNATYPLHAQLILTATHQSCCVLFKQPQYGANILTKHARSYSTRELQAPVETLCAIEFCSASAYVTHNAPQLVLKAIQYRTENTACCGPRGGLGVNVSTWTWNPIYYHRLHGHCTWCD